MRKAQVLTADYVAGLTIFATVIAIGFLLWNTAEGKKDWAFDIDRMQKKAMAAADALVTGEGLPQGWTPANVEEIGISTSDHVINGTLVDNMLGVSYAKAKNAFGLEVYDFYINITNYTGGAIASYGIPPANARDLVLTQRVAFFKNTSAPVRAIVSLYVWR